MKAAAAAADDESEATHERGPTRFELRALRHPLFSCGSGSRRPQRTASCAQVSSLWTRIPPACARGVASVSARPAVFTWVTPSDYLEGARCAASSSTRDSTNSIHAANTRRPRPTLVRLHRLSRAAQLGQRSHTTAHTGESAVRTHRSESLRSHRAPSESSLPSAGRYHMEHGRSRV